MSSSWIRTKLETVVPLAYLLECVETGTAIATADGYRRLVLRLQAALSEDIPAEALQAILSAYPATGELFENLHYGHSGLSRAPLERSVSSERLAKAGPGSRGQACGAQDHLAAARAGFRQHECPDAPPSVRLLNRLHKARLGWPARSSFQRGGPFAACAQARRWRTPAQHELLRVCRPHRGTRFAPNMPTLQA